MVFFTVTEWSEFPKDGKSRDFGADCELPKDDSRATSYRLVMILCKIFNPFQGLSCKFRTSNFHANSSVSCEAENWIFKCLCVSVSLGHWSNYMSCSESLSNYRAGFNNCANKVCSLMENQTLVDTKLREQILVRLAATYSPVKSDNVYYSGSVSAPEIYALQNITDSSCCCVSSPPPSPTSSAFSPFEASNRGVTPNETGINGYHSSVNVKSTDAESTKCTSRVECRLPLWRPWISSSEDGAV